MSKVIKEILAEKSKYEEVAQKAFDAINPDKKPEIDSAQFEKAMQQIANEMGTDVPSKEDVMEIMEMLDEDKSGKISLVEFTELIRDVLEAMLDDCE